MLTSFFVENFRLFQRLEIARLGRVNLLAGKNNSGKSALLEAIELYASNASLTTIQRLISNRAEGWNEHNQAEIQANNELSIRHLFRGHHLPKANEQGIIIGSGEGTMDQLHLRTAIYQIEDNEEGITQRRLLTPQEAADFEGDFDISLVVEGEDELQRVLKLNRTSTISWTRARIAVPRKIKYQCMVVPTSNMASKDIANLWDEIGLTPARDEVIAGLQLIMPSITALQFVENSNPNRTERIPLIGTDDGSEPMPLKSMGDGMTRLFHILVALVSAKDGILLIDEFENGIHYAAQSDIWKIVFRLAESLNVQVFATTHSKDCITSFEEAWKEYPSDGAFFRLQMNKHNVPSIRAYSLGTLIDSIETNTEVR